MKHEAKTMSGKPVSDHPLLRHRDGHHAHVTYEELFFDLAYVFADRAQA